MNGIQMQMDFVKDINKFNEDARRQTAMRIA